MSMPRDNLRKIIEQAARNELATLHSEAPFASFLDRANDIFLATNDVLHNSPDSMLVMFLGRAHGAFIGAVRMGASGQLPETFMLLRGAIENALYALHIKADPAPPDRAIAWSRRSAGEAESKRVRKEFAVGNVMRTLRSRSAELHAVAAELYDRCLDLGGHPNERGHFAAATFTDVRSDGAAAFKVNLFTPDHEMRRFLLRSCAEVVVTVLYVFVEVFRERFQLTDFPNQVGRLKQHLDMLCAQYRRA